MEKKLTNKQIQDIYEYVALKEVSKDECVTYIMQKIDCTYEFAKVVYGSINLFAAMYDCIEEKAQK